MINEILLKIFEAPEGVSEFILDGYKIKISKSENCVNIEIQENSDVEDFDKFLDKMDDNLFLEVCESIPNLLELSDLLETDASKATKIFKDYTDAFIKEKINYYEQCYRELYSGDNK